VGGKAEIYKTSVPTSGASSPRPDTIKRLVRNSSTNEDPVWSPDGEQILFVSDREGTRGVYVMKNDGSDVRSLGPVAIETGSPQWSPDGRWIAYIARKGDIPFIQMVNVADGRHGEIVMDGTELAEINWVPTEWMLTQKR